MAGKDYTEETEETVDQELITGNQNTAYTEASSSADSSDGGTDIDIAAIVKAYKKSLTQAEKTYTIPETEGDPEKFTFISKYLSKTIDQGFRDALLKIVREENGPINLKDNSAKEEKTIIEAVQLAIIEAHKLSNIAPPFDSADGVLGPKTKKAVKNINDYYRLMYAVEMMDSEEVSEASEDNNLLMVNKKFLVFLDLLLYMEEEQKRKAKIPEAPQSGITTITQIKRAKPKNSSRESGTYHYERNDDLGKITIDDGIIQRISFTKIDADFDDYDDIWKNRDGEIKGLTYLNIYNDFDQQGFAIIGSSHALDSYLNDGISTFEIIEKKSEAVPSGDKGEQNAQDTPQPQLQEDEKERPKYQLLVFQNNKLVRRFDTAYYHEFENQNNNYFFGGLEVKNKIYVDENGEHETSVQINVEMSVPKEFQQYEDTPLASLDMKKEGYSFEFHRFEDLNNVKYSAYFSEIGKTAGEEINIKAPSLYYDRAKVSEEAVKKDIMPDGLPSNVDFQVFHRPLNDEGKHEDLTENSGWGNWFSEFRGDYSENDPHSTHLNNPHKSIQIDLQNRFGDKVAIVSYANSYFIGFKTTPIDFEDGVIQNPAEYQYFELNVSDEAGLSRIKELFGEGVEVYRADNEYTFIKNRNKETKMGDVLFKMSHIMRGTSFEHRTVDIVLGKQLFTWDVYSNNSVVKYYPEEEEKPRYAWEIDLFPSTQETIKLDREKRRKKEQWIDADSYLKYARTSHLGTQEKLLEEQIDTIFKNAAVEAQTILGDSKVDFYTYDGKGSQDPTEIVENYKDALERMTELKPYQLNVDGAIQNQLSSWRNMYIEYLRYLIANYESIVDMVHVRIGKTELSGDDELSGSLAGKESHFTPLKGVFYSNEMPEVPIPVDLYILYGANEWVLSYTNKMDASQSRLFKSSALSDEERYKELFHKLDHHGGLDKGYVYFEDPRKNKEEGGKRKVIGFELIKEWEFANQVAGGIMMVAAAVAVAALVASSGGLALGPIMAGLSTSANMALLATGVYFGARAIQNELEIEGRWGTEMAADYVDILAGVAGPFAMLKVAKSASRARYYLGNAGEIVVGLSDLLAIGTVGAKMWNNEKVGGFEALGGLLAGVGGVTFFASKMSQPKHFRRFVKPKSKPKLQKSDKHFIESDGPVSDGINKAVDDMLDRLSPKEVENYAEFIEHLKNEQKIKLAALVHGLKNSPDLLDAVFKKLINKNIFQTSVGKFKGKKYTTEMYNHRVDDMLALFSKGPFTQKKAFGKRSKTNENLENKIDQIKLDEKKFNQDLGRLNKEKNQRSTNKTKLTEEFEVEYGKSPRLGDELKAAKREHKNADNELTKEKNRRKNEANRHERMYGQKPRTEKDLEKAHINYKREQVVLAENQGKYDKNKKAFEQKHNRELSTENADAFKQEMDIEVGKLDKSVKDIETDIRKNKDRFDTSFSGEKPRTKQELKDAKTQLEHDRKAFSKKEEKYSKDNTAFEEKYQRKIGSDKSQIIQDQSTVDTKINNINEDVKQLDARKKEIEDHDLPQATKARKEFEQKQKELDTDVKNRTNEINTKKTELEELETKINDTPGKIQELKEAERQNRIEMISLTQDVKQLRRTKTQIDAELENYYRENFNAEFSKDATITDKINVLKSKNSNAQHDDFIKKITDKNIDYTKKEKAYRNKAESIDSNRINIKTELSDWTDFQNRIPTERDNLLKGQNDVTEMEATLKTKENEALEHKEKVQEKIDNEQNLIEEQGDVDKKLGEHSEELERLLQKKEELKEEKRLFDERVNNESEKNRLETEENRTNIESDLEQFSIDHGIAVDKRDKTKENLQEEYDILTLGEQNMAKEKQLKREKNILDNEDAIKQRDDKIASDTQKQEKSKIQIDKEDNIEGVANSIIESDKNIKTTKEKYNKNLSENLGDIVKKETESLHLDAEQIKKITGKIQNSSLTDFISTLSLFKDMSKTGWDPVIMQSEIGTANDNPKNEFKKEKLQDELNQIVIMEEKFLNGIKVLEELNEDLQKNDGIPKPLEIVQQTIDDMKEALPQCKKIKINLIIELFLLEGSTDQTNNTLPKYLEIIENQISITKASFSKEAMNNAINGIEDMQNEIAETNVNRMYLAKAEMGDPKELRKLNNNFFRFYDLVLSGKTK